MRQLHAIAVVVLVSCAGPSLGSGRYEKFGDSGIRQFAIAMHDMRLATGLRVLVEEDHRSPIVGVMTLCAGGSATDPTGLPGLANLVSRASLRAREGDGTLRQRLEHAGAAQLYAGADWDRSRFYAVGPKSALPKLLRLSAARLTAPLVGVTEDTLALERDAIASELLAEEDVAAPVWLVARIQAALFPSQHPYAHPAAGSSGSLARVRLADAQAFARAHYRASATTLVLFGDVDASAVEPLLNATLPVALRGVDAPRPWAQVAAVPVSTPPDPEPAPLLQRVYAHVEVPELWIAWTLPGGYGADAGPVTLIESVLREAMHVRPAATAPEIDRKVAQLIAGPGRTQATPLLPVAQSTRLIHPGAASPLQGPEQEAESLQAISTFPSRFDDLDIEATDVFTIPGARASLLVCRLTLREGAHPERTIEHTMDRIRARWYQTGPDEFYRELRLVGLSRVKLAAALVLATEDPVARADRIATFADATSDPRLYQGTFTRVAATTTGKLEDFAYQYLSRARARAFLFQPVPKDFGPHALASARTAPAPLPEPPPTLAGVAVGDLARPITATRLRSFRLRNGLEVVLGRLPGVPLTTARLGIYGGKATEHPLGVAELYEQVAKIGRRYGRPSDFSAEESATLEPDLQTIQERGGADLTGKLLALLWDRVGHRWVERGDLLNFLKFRLPTRKRREDMPEARAELAFVRALYGDHPYSRRATSRELAGISVAEIESWRQRTMRPDNALLVAIGDFDVDRVAELCEQWFGDWTAERPGPEGVVRMYYDRNAAHSPAPPAAPPHAQTLVTHRPGASESDLTLGCLLPETSDEHKTVAYELAAEVARRRFDDLLREQLGASAGVRGRADVLFGGTASLMLGMSLSGVELPRLLALAHDAWNDLVAGRLTAGELDRARWTLADAYAIRFSTTESIADAILEARRRGFALAAIDRYPSHLASATLQEVQAALGSCRDREVISVVGDDATARAALASGWK
jgi:predicted Zn-dependent peptidase